MDQKIIQINMKIFICIIYCFQMDLKRFQNETLKSELNQKWVKDESKIDKIKEWTEINHSRSKVDHINELLEISLKLLAVKRRQILDYGSFVATSYFCQRARSLPSIPSFLHNESLAYELFIAAYRGNE